MRLNKAELQTCGAETRTLLNLAQGCLTVVTGDSFLCRVTQSDTHVRTTVGNSGRYRATIHLLPYNNTEGTRCLKVINNSVIHHSISL